MPHHSPETQFQSINTFAQIYHGLTTTLIKEYSTIRVMNPRVNNDNRVHVVVSTTCFRMFGTLLSLMNFVY